VSPTKRTDFHKVSGGSDESRDASTKPTKRKSVSLRKTVPAVKTVPKVQNVPSVDEAQEEALEDRVAAAEKRNSVSMTKKRKSVSLRKTVPSVKIVPKVQKVPSVEENSSGRAGIFKAHPGGQIGGQVAPPGVSAEAQGTNVGAGMAASAAASMYDDGQSGGVPAPGVSATAAGGMPADGIAGSAGAEVAIGQAQPRVRGSVRSSQKAESPASMLEDLQNAGELRRARAANLGWIIATIILIIVAAAGFWFFWQEWVRYDDTQDIQGTWLVSTTGAAISVNDETIRIASDAAYEYEMNTTDKSLSFSFLKLTGTARYRFGGDRASFVVVEGQETGMVQLIWEDFWYQVRVLWAQTTGGELPDPSADFTPSETVTVTLFVRNLPQKAA